MTTDVVLKNWDDWANHLVTRAGRARAILTHYQEAGIAMLQESDPSDVEFKETLISDIRTITDAIDDLDDVILGVPGLISINLN